MKQGIPNDSFESLPVTAAFQLGDADHSAVLPSFPQIRQQNLMTLYGDRNTNDKSRAGHVDEHIQEVVNCINRHESFVTLSSCSGRIVLFDPTASSKDLFENPNSSSGKGGSGAWLFVSHDVVDPSTALLPFFSSEEQDGPTRELEQEHLCFLKLEPMLLHVAACNLYYGKLLLQVALQHGFRESGLIVTDQRVTVAIRTNGLSLSIPLSRCWNHPLRPTAAYLEAVTMECNRRLLLNLQSLNKLHLALQQKLFPLELQRSDMDTSSNAVLNISVNGTMQLPSLNLYGHTMVAVEFVAPQSSNVERIAHEVAHAPPTVTDLLVFGGYGPGPHLPAIADASKPSSQRSSNVYRLRRDRRQEWSAHWENVEFIVPSFDNVISMNLSNFGHLQVQPGGWDARQSATALNLTELLPQKQFILESGDSIKSHILIFGGRYGPAKPIGTLFVYEYSLSTTNSMLDVSSGQMFEPQDTRGTIPTPRWGHSFTPLKNSNNSTWQYDIPLPISLLIGGRQAENTCLDSLYLLTLVPSAPTTIDSPLCNTEKEQNTALCFFWECLSIEDSISPELSRFHHTAVQIDDDHVFVFGGLFCVDDLLSSFSLEGNSSQSDHCDMNSALILTLKKNSDDDCKRLIATVEPINNTTVSHRFGHTVACLLPEQLGATETSASPESLFLLIGGVASDSSSVAALIEYVRLSRSNDQWSLGRQDVEWDSSCAHPAVDFGTLVHHCGIELSSVESTADSDHKQDRRRKSTVIVLTGGGASGFAFQESYAKSFMVSFASDRRTCDEAESLSSGNPGCCQPHSVMSALIPGGVKSAVTDSATIPQRYDVVYVFKHNAKLLKTSLERLEVLSKHHRLSAVDAEGVIQWFDMIEREVMLETLMAVPLVAGGLDRIFVRESDGTYVPSKEDDEDSNHGYLDVILGYGRQTCLRSTGAFARGTKGVRG